MAGAGYDLSVSTFSPDGKLFQVEYGMKAAESGSLTMAMTCLDGIVFAVERKGANKMALPTSGRRIHAVDKHIGIAIAGLLPDGRKIVQTARDEAANYLQTYGEKIPLQVLADRIGLYVHAHTCYWHVRPFGVQIIVAGIEPANLDNPEFTGEIYCIDPSGATYKYKANALGQGKQSARTQIERLDLPKLTVNETIKEAIKISRNTQDERAEQEADLEIMIIANHTNRTLAAPDPQLILDITREIEAAA